MRELEEELGIQAKPEQLHFAGYHQGGFQGNFHGKPFHDYEISSVYIYQEPVQIEQLCLQKSEVEEVRWMDLQECRKRIADGSLPNCIYPDELELIEKFMDNCG